MSRTPKSAGGRRAAVTTRLTRLSLLWRIDYRHRDFDFPTLGVTSEANSVAPTFLTRQEFASWEESIEPLCQLKAALSPFLHSKKDFSRNKL